MKLIFEIISMSYRRVKPLIPPSFMYAMRRLIQPYSNVGIAEG